MNNQSFIEGGLYIEILFVLIAVVFAYALYFLARSVTIKSLISKGRIAGQSLSRLILPLVLLLVALCIKIIPFREILPLSSRFYEYLDALLLFLLFFLLVRLIDASLLTWFTRKHITYPLPRVLHGFFLFVLYLAILFSILKGILGINITPFLATSAILTMILGLALQGVLSNIASGMSLHFTKSFSKGDWIKVGENEGVVIDTNWRETRIMDLFSNIVVIPNNTIASETLINFTHPDKRTALTIPVKVSYQSPPAAVLEALREAASDVPEVSSSPSPEAFIMSYDDFGISYVVKFWITDYKQKFPIIGKVGRLIWYKFKRRNIEIPVPVSDKLADVLKTVQEAKGLEYAEKKEERNFRDLVNSSFLRYQEGERAGELLVPEEEIHEMASSIRRQRFFPGEILFKQGEKGESCYIVAAGRIKGIVTYEEKGKEYASEFQAEPGDVFGEMSLFTGMPRTATGIVEEESELLEIKGEDFALLLSRNPKLTEVIAEIVSIRNKKNQEFLRKIKALSEKDIDQSCSKRSILKRMKSFILSLTK